MRGLPEGSKTPNRIGFGWGMGLDGDGWACLRAVTMTLRQRRCLVSGSSVVMAVSQCDANIWRPVVELSSDHREGRRDSRRASAYTPRRRHMQPTVPSSVEELSLPSAAGHIDPATAETRPRPDLATICAVGNHTCSPGCDVTVFDRPECWALTPKLSACTSHRHGCPLRAGRLARGGVLLRLGPTD